MNRYTFHVVNYSLGLHIYVNVKAELPVSVQNRAVNTYEAWKFSCT